MRSIWVRPILAWVLGAILCSHLAGRTFSVGPGQELSAIGQVPWEALQAGDVVRIHWQPEPYHEKWALGAAGTAEAPITVTGVAGPQGKMPVVDGQSAATRDRLNFWGEDRAVLKIGSTNAAPDLLPSHIVIENLEFCGARPPFKFRGRTGETAYRDNAAAVWIEKGEHVTLRNCVLRDCANGLVSSRETRRVLVEGCSIFGNGTELGVYHHNAYTESQGITFQFNHFGPLRKDAFGNNLKDRSSGTVVRYNWIEGGNRLLDLVESDASPILESPDYRQTFVYGNVLIKLPDTANSQVIHYGGDQEDAARYRNGTLYLCHNTIVSRRSGNATLLLRLSTPQDTAIVRNNILWCDSLTGYFQPLLPPGKAHFAANWCPRQFEAMLRLVGRDGGVDAGAGQIFGDTPGFRDSSAGDFRLLPGSPCSGRAGPLPDAMREHPVISEYVPHRGQRSRSAKEPLDLGAFGVAADGGPHE